MRLNQFAQGFALTNAIATHVEDRVQLALATASGEIRTVAVRMTDINGAKGGQDKRCRVVVALRKLGTVVVQAVHADLYAAIDKAVSAAREAVARHLKRRRTLQREHGPRRLFD
jgi:putative sigma-54 modulation protein